MLYGDTTKLPGSANARHRSNDAALLCPTATRTACEGTSPAVAVEPVSFPRQASSVRARMKSGVAGRDCRLMLDVNSEGLVDPLLDDLHNLLREHEHSVW